MDITAVFFKNIRGSVLKAVTRYNDLPMKQSNSTHFWKSSSLFVDKSSVFCEAQLKPGFDMKRWISGCVSM